MEQPGNEAELVFSVSALMDFNDESVPSADTEAAGTVNLHEGGLFRI